MNDKLFPMKFFTFIIAAFLVVACSVEESSLVLPVDQERMRDEAFVYEAYVSKEAWQQLSSLKERMDACQVPADIAEKLTTDALIRTCINHPFAQMYMAYKNEFEIVKILTEENNAFKELLGRCDAAERLVSYYGRDPDLSLGQMHFLELLLGSGLFPSIFKEPLSSRLRVFAEKNLSYRRLMPEHYSVHSWKTAELLLLELAGSNTPDFETADAKLKQIESKAIKTKASGDYLGPVTVYTPYGTSISGALFEDFNATEKAYWDNYYCSLFPSATLLESSTYTYNEYSYATNMALGGPTCMINSISPYFTENAYVQTPSYLTADLVYFPTQDYPAEATYIPGVFVSKWSTGPLMQHSMADCPYGLASPQYYKYNCKFFSISGPDLVYSETTAPYTYSYSCSFGTAPGGSFVWSVDGPNELSSDYTMYVSTGDLKIVFNDTGEYHIWCHYNYHGVSFGVASYFVLAVNAGRIEEVGDDEE